MPLDDEERRESVATALERGEAKSNGGSQHHAVTGRVRANTERKDNDQCTFYELLDEADLQVPEQARAEHQPVFECRGGQRAQDSGEDERGHDAPR